MLTVIQGFDPPGVAARDLQECLLLQLEAAGLEDSDEADVIRNHFEALKNRKFSDIAREMKITPREVQEIAQRIGELDPRPGLSANAEGARAIVPDLEVVKVDEDGDEYAVYLNDAQPAAAAGQPGLRGHRPRATTRTRSSSSTRRSGTPSGSSRPSSSAGAP